jgi:hypothetical protein
MLQRGSWELVRWDILTEKGFETGQILKHMLLTGQIVAALNIFLGGVF